MISGTALQERAYAIASKDETVYKFIFGKFTGGTSGDIYHKKDRDQRRSYHPQPLMLGECRHCCLFDNEGRPCRGYIRSPLINEGSSVFTARYNRQAQKWNRQIYQRKHNALLNISLQANATLSTGARVEYQGAKSSNLLEEHLLQILERTIPVHELVGLPCGLVPLSSKEVPLNSVSTPNTSQV